MQQLAKLWKGMQWKVTAAVESFGNAGKTYHIRSESEDQWK